MTLAMKLFHLLFVLGSQDLNRPPPPAYNKFSSLDRRALARRHHAAAAGPPNYVNNNTAPTNQTTPSHHQLISGGGGSNAPNQIKLSTFSPHESKVGLVKEFIRRIHKRFFFIKEENIYSML